MQAPVLDGVVRYHRIGVRQRFDVVTFGRIDHGILSKINNGDPDTDYNGAVSEQPFAVQWTVIFGSAVDGRRIIRFRYRGHVRIDVGDRPVVMSLADRNAGYLLFNVKQNSRKH